MKRENQQRIAAWAKLIRVQQVLLQAVEEDLKQAGLPPLSWYDVLLELNRAPHKSLRLSELGERTLLAKNNATRLVDRLEREGLVERIKCTSDGRGVFAQITSGGIQLLKAMWPTYRRSIQAHFGRYLDSSEIEQLLGALTKLDASRKSVASLGE